MNCLILQENVLIDDDGVACLADFGLSEIRQEVLGSGCLTSTIDGAARFRAPELMASVSMETVEDYHPVVTWRCDIYSFGSIALNVRTLILFWTSDLTDIGVLVR